MTTILPPTSALQIKYVSRLSSNMPRFRHQRTFSTPLLTATITETPTSYRINTTIRNITSNPKSQTLSIHSWPMFEPEIQTLVGTASGTIPAMEQREIVVEVRKRDLAVKGGKGWIVEEGIYMFEVKNVEDLAMGSGVVKQVSVVGRMEWDD